MTESPLHAPSAARLLFASRQGASNTPAPTHHRLQVSDDFISHLTPLTAYDTFRAPTGPLKTCMDLATATERSFAIRAALASKKIYEWLDELRDWPWAADGGAGFQAPELETKTLPTRGRSGSTVSTAQVEVATYPDAVYIGSLLESDVARYEKRLDQIQGELNKLEIEDIKNHVLRNYILPLSRPGTPASPSLERHQFGLESLASYTKLDDMTAVITSTVVQALPNLSKLTRLMNMWTVRLTVLRRIPTWLDAVVDAESALGTGWATIGTRDNTAEGADNHKHPRQPALSRHDFQVMSHVLEKKVAKAAHALDYMLDTLEGRDDVLPDEWLDRMDKVERDFSEWTASCEKKIRDAELETANQRAKEEAMAKSLQIPSVEIDDMSDESPTVSAGNEDDEMQSLAPARDASMTPELVPTSARRTSPHTPPRDARSMSASLSDMPPVPEDPEEDEDEDSLQTPLTSVYDTPVHDLGSPIILSDPNGEDDHMRQQIAEILQNIPAKIQLSSKPTFSHLNPPDLQLPYTKPKTTTASDKTTRSRSTMSSRAGTPAFMLAPVARPRHSRANQDIKMYHLSRANGEAPIKLFIRCVGENGERVMVRVGGGWADLGEYLKEYAIHHGRRSHRGGEQKLEVRDIPRISPNSRPGSAADASPLFVKKTRKADESEILLGPRLPRTPHSEIAPRASEPSSARSTSAYGNRSRSSSRLSAAEEESSLGMAGPRASRKEISVESLEWVESIKNKVRAASGGSEISRSTPVEGGPKRFGEIGRAGGTKRVFRKAT
ncbi:hypothetical protein BD289DRAFT_376615 [Coniella lustricola]|uniref:GAR domain-containing protein n=1 Tax=Coniella lustricola TaxID=2025994 RepID=A0A2T2ZWL3_9PEZI|nr:hypothetical protein BD289DRAFT_376615 [Coniella lustricola]